MVFLFSQIRALVRKFDVNEHTMLRKTSNTCRMSEKSDRCSLRSIKSRDLPEVICFPIDEAIGLAFPFIFIVEMLLLCIEANSQPDLDVLCHVLSVMSSEGSIIILLPERRTYL